MCGIFGAIGPSSEPVARRAAGLLAHRGPDGHGTFVAREAALALTHTRLSILDLGQGAAQPMTDADAHATIVFNGEIYNFRDLRAQLEGGYHFRSTGDTEVLLAAYLRWGEDMLGKLNGIFAFAIYDHRDRSLLLARDGFGVKPLYWTRTASHFAFASEMKALLHVPGLDRSLDHQGISHYLTYLYSPGERTPFRSVRKFKPGHALRLRPGLPDREWAFYELPYELSVLPFSAKGAMEEFRYRLDTAVERQMVSDAPMGAFLSGGLDSSSICALAQRHSPGGRLDCYTIDVRFPKTGSDGFAEDLPYARRVAETLGVDLHVVSVPMESLLDLEKLVWHLDEPQADPAALNNFYICQFARSQGVKVMLSGAGGDDVFSGYRRHQALNFEHYWRWLPAGLRAAVAKASGLAPRDRPWGRRLSKALRQAGSASQDRMVGYFQWLEPAQVEMLWSKEVRAMGALPDPDLPFYQALRSLPEGTPELNQMLYLEAKYFLCDHNLNYTDKMSMAAGVEVRVPFLDPDLVSFAARLPVDFKQHGSVGKWIFRKAMEGVLPPDVIYRPKTGFGVPLRGWIASQRQRLEEDYLSRESLLRRGLFDPDAVQKLISENARGAVDATYTIVALACIEIWCRQFVDAEII